MKAPTDAEVFGGWSCRLNATGRPWGSGPWAVGSLYHTPQPPDDPIIRCRLAAEWCRAIASKRLYDARRSESASGCRVWAGTPTGARLARLAQEYRDEAAAMRERAADLDRMASSLC